MNPVSAWLEAREPRERVVLLGGGAAVAAMLVFFGLIEPLAERRAQLSQRVAEQERGVAWMTSAAAKLAERPQTVRRGNVRRDNRSLLALVDDTVRSHNIAGALRRAEPGVGGEVRLWFDRVSFNQLIDWLVAMDANYGVSVSEFNADRADGTGMVDARVSVLDR